MTLEDLYRLLRSGHVQAQGVLDTLDEPLLVLDQSLSVVTANPAFLRTFKADRDDTVGHGLFNLGNGQWDIPDLRRLLSNIIPQATAVVDYEISHSFPRIGQHTFLITARKLAHPDDNSQQILIVFTDVTKRRRDSEAKEILLNEARHRMKNLMAVVRALARRTQTEGRTATEYRDALLSRLDGLTATNDLTMNETETVDCQTVFKRSLEPFVDRIEFSQGPDLQLDSAQIQPLGMSLNELATNAAKYGALSVPEGNVHLSWEIESDVEQRMLSLVWAEKNGPKVERPDHEGFGTGLIKHSINDDLDGDIQFAYDSDGLTVRMKIPISPEPQ